MHRWLQAGSRLLHLPVHQVFYNLSPTEVSWRTGLPLLCSSACNACK
jgi:hypothetical protein